MGEKLAHLREDPEKVLDGIKIAARSKVIVYKCTQCKKVHYIAVDGGWTSKKYGEVGHKRDGCCSQMEMTSAYLVEDYDAT